MSHGVSFMNWLEEHHPDLFEIFSKDGIFMERKNDKYILHITILDEDISLPDLNRLQKEWDNFMLLDQKESEPTPLLISQNKF